MPSVGSMFGVTEEHEPLVQMTRSLALTSPVSVMLVATPSLMLLGVALEIMPLTRGASTVSVMPLCSTLSLPPAAL